MSAPTTRISAQLVSDLNETLMRLKQARLYDHLCEVVVLEKRLDWLCDKLPVPRKDNS